jgi:hypothetical protein
MMTTARSDAEPGGPALSECAGFGALVQTIAATRYLGRRICFSAIARTYEVTEWAGLWLRVDGPLGMLALDNMFDRPLRGTTEWTRASIVLDVAHEATHLLFGALLSGAGALDITRPRFEEVGEAVPATAAPLPDEPQDFGAVPLPRRPGRRGWCRLAWSRLRRTDPRSTRRRAASKRSGPRLGSTANTSKLRLIASAGSTDRAGVDSAALCPRGSVLISRPCSPARSLAPPRQHETQSPDQTSARIPGTAAVIGRRMTQLWLMRIKWQWGNGSPQKSQPVTLYLS